MEHTRVHESHRDSLVNGIVTLELMFYLHFLLLAPVDSRGPVRERLVSEDCTLYTSSDRPPC